MSQLFGLMLSIIVGFGITIVAMPYLIRILQKKGYMVRDYYKPKNKLVPTNGAIIILIICFVVLLVFPAVLYAVWRVNKLLFHMEVFENYLALTPLAQMAVLVVAIYGLFGLIDDYLHITHKTKILIPLFFAIPLMSPMYESVLYLPFFGVVDNTTVCTLPFGGDFKVINLYRLFFVPVAVMVVANLSNMHSGFNGLQSGLSAIVLSVLIAKSIYIGKITDIIGLGAVAGAIAGFWWFNKYPAQVFDGNVGAFSMGAAIGVLICVQGFIISGFIMLIPHIIDFCLYSYVRIRGYEFIKFGKVRADGTIAAPNPLKLKFLFPYYLRLTEKQTVYILYGLTTIFCVIGFFTPY